MNNIDWHARAETANLNVQNIIDGQSMDCVGDRTIKKLSPRDGSLLYEFCEGDGNEVDTAVANALRAFKDGRWSGQSVHQRKAILEKLITLIETHQHELALYDCLDVGKPIKNALNEDIPLSLMFLKNYVENADKLLSPSGIDGSEFVYQQLKPMGVVGGIVGWNYPLLMAVMKMGPALAVGNCLVLKPSEFSPLSAMRLAMLALEAGIPAGVFNVVQGSGSVVGAQLARHPDVNLLSFTGSSATGRQVMIASAESNMKRLILECGGKSPYIVFDDCPNDLDFIAKNIVETAFRNQGEFCSASTRLLVQDNIKDQLLPKILAHTAKLKPGDPLDPMSSFGPLISETHMNKVLAYIDHGPAQGAKLVVGGKRVHVSTKNKNLNGYYVEPTIFDNVHPQDKLAQEEIFGPVLSVLTFKDEAEAISLANNTCYGLAAYVATESLGRTQRLTQSLRSGFVVILGSSTPSQGSVIQIGSEPQGQSGFGCETGLNALASYSLSTTVNILT